MGMSAKKRIRKCNFTDIQRIIKDSRKGDYCCPSFTFSRDSYIGYPFNVVAIDLLERLLRFNPADRLTAEEALTHPYFLDLHCSCDEHVVENPFFIEHEVSHGCLGGEVNIVM